MAAALRCRATPSASAVAPDVTANFFAYRFGSQQLNVHGPGSDPYPVARDRVRPGNGDLCFVWARPTEGAIEHLARAGVTIEEGPVGRNGARGVGRSVYFRDPDGSLLELITYADR